MTKRTAIVVIATGPYNALLHDFAAAASENLFVGEPRRLVVLSDAVISGGRNVTHGYACVQGGTGPDNTKRRKFDVIRRAGNLLRGCSHVIYLDSTMRVVRPVSHSDVFGDGGNLVGLAHSWLHFGNDSSLGTDKASIARRAFYPCRGSAAYKNPCEVAGVTGGWLIGGLMGGPVPLFLEMCATCAGWVEADASRGSFPRFHDEPYWNSFCTSKGVRVLDPSYGWPDVNTTGCVRNPRIRVALKGSGFEARMESGLAGRVDAETIRLDCDF